MKKLVLLYLLISFGFIQRGFSQWSKTDSTEIFQQLSIAFGYAYNQPDTAKELGNLALNKSKKVGYQYGEMKSLNVLGILEDVTSNYDSSLALYFRARKIALELKDSLSIAQIGVNIGLIYWNKEKQDSALIWYRKSEAYFRRVNNKKSLSSALNNIALIYDDKDRPDKSIQLHFEALKIREQLGDAHGIGASMHNISMAYTFLGKNDSAIIWGKKALPYRLSAKDDYGLSKTYNNLALSYSNLNENDSAAMYWKKSIELKKKVKDWYGLASSYNNLGSMYIGINQLVKARECIQNGLKIAEKQTYKRIMNELYGNMALLADIEGDFEQASAFKDSVIKFNKHLYEDETNNKLQQLQVEFEVDRKEAKIESLNLENQIEKERVEQKKIQFYGALALAVLLLLTGMFGFKSFRKNQELKHNEELNLERLKGNNAVLEAIEQERSQIAKDLHDGIGQQLAAIKLGWDAVITQYKKGKGANPEKEQLITQLINNASSDIRSISHRMMPRALQEKGLVVAIEEMLSLSLDPKKTIYKFEHFQIEGRLDSKLEVSLYRIIQELIKNIIKHSLASEVHVQLMLVKKQLVLIVEDNGIGMKDISNENEGIGLLSLKSRVDSFHGHINYEPSPNSGTLVTVRIPLG